MRATEILMSDHRQAEQLMSRLEEAEGQDAGDGYRPIFEQLQTALLMHMKAEEEIFYPAIAGYEELKDLVVESYDEHALVKSQLTQMAELEPQTDEFQDVLAQMKAGIEHHVGEEENDMFPKTEEIMGVETLQSLGAEIEQLKSKTPTTRTARM